MLFVYACSHRRRETIIETCRLTSSHVKIGVPLPGNVYDEHGTMLLSKGQVLSSQEQLDTLLTRGMYVEIGVFEAQFRSSSSAQPVVEDKKFDPFFTRNSLKTHLNRMLRGIIDASVEPAAIVEFAGQVQGFASTDTEAAIAACLLDRQEELHAVAHSLNTAIFCALLARRLEWPEARQRSLVCAALTMNLGMLELQQRLLRQATPLPPALQTQVEAHPTESLNFLKAIGVDDPLWLAAVAQHHEKPGGNGYPEHLPTPGEDGQLLRLVDVFDARASSRADRHALPPAQTIRALFVDEGQGPCAALVASLVKMFGMYPSGCFVKLTNGELGVVFRHGESPNTPLVASVATSSGMPCMQPVRRDTSREGFAIASPVSPEKITIGYDLSKLWLTSARKA